MKLFSKILFPILIVLAVVGCKKDIVDESLTVGKTADQYSYKIVNEWTELWAQIERYAVGYRPCPTASALGYLGLANYEACVSGMPKYNSLAPRYLGLNIPQAFPNQEYHWPTVVNAVNSFLFSRLFPDVDKKLYGSIKELSDKNNKIFSDQIDQEVFNRSKLHGEAVGLAFWDWMKTDPVTFDGYKDPFKENTWRSRVNEPGAWVPTVPGPNDGMFAYWGKGRLLAIGDDMKVCRPYKYYVGQYSENPNSTLYQQALEVMSQNTPSLSYQSEWLGEFWSDDLVGLTFSPSTRYISIAHQVFEKEKCSLEKALVTNAKIGIALNDAGIGCWNSKYIYNLERPETYIKRLIDPSWEPNLDNPTTGEKGISPSFPAYPSGHATFGGAAMEALASEFGYAYGMTDNCHKNRAEFAGYPRKFNSFFEMALENAWSRVPLGVHYRMDAEEGLRYGTEIGRIVNNLTWKK